MRLLIAIDDTDNLESRGTGFRARTLGARIESSNLGRLRGVTRHQLLVHPEIPYTSHNSALCIDVETESGSLTELQDYCREFLLAEAAPGSDAGLCVANWDDVDDAVIGWGRSAQRQILYLPAAHELASAHGIMLEGLTGERIGAIGALAAAGLRRTGDDGRFVWLRGVRELNGVHRVETLLKKTGIEQVRARTGERPEPGDRVLVDPWPRALLIKNRAVLLVDKSKSADDHEWQLVGRDVIRQY